MTDPRDRRPRMGAMGLGFEFAAALIGGSLVGLWVDRRYDTGPWGVLIGALVGLVAGFYNFLRASLAAIRAERPPERSEEDEE